MPKVSIAVSTNRPHFWARFCQAVARNTVDLEVIFVGPCVPGQGGPLPVPVRHVVSTAQPVLCWHLGAMTATGDLLALSTDDGLYTPGCLDAAAKHLADGHFGHLAGHPCDMLAPRYVRNGVDQLHDQRLLGIPAMPLIPICGFTTTDAYRRVGGLDRRFRAVLWDVDLFMRCHEAGGRTTLLDGHVFHEDNPDQHNHLFADNHQRDRAVLTDLWFRSGAAQLTRNAPIESFTASDLAAI